MQYMKNDHNEDVFFSRGLVAVCDIMAQGEGVFILMPSFVPEAIFALVTPTDIGIDSVMFYS